MRIGHGLPLLDGDRLSAGGRRVGASMRRWVV
jgi:hypothetical protein